MSDVDLTSLSLSEIRSRLTHGDIRSAELVEAYLRSYEEDRERDEPVNGYVEFFDDAVAQAKKADEKRARGDGSPLLGLPIAVKDNMHIAGKGLTCSSRILQGYTATYSATVVSRLREQGAVLLGRTNMDEFAMGSSCEYSCYGATRNPIDRSRIAGGSSGGSAAVVAARQAPFALGSDTGGSVRLPASFCGVYGLKPTYGTLSRYGLVAFGSSLDQIGFLARTPEDIALVLKHCAGKDPLDATSKETDFGDLDSIGPATLSGLRIGVPEQLTGESVDQEVQVVFDDFVRWLTDAGAQIEYFSLPLLDAAVAMYYIIAPAEASSNLSRYDGIKYGLRAEDYGNLEEMYEATRDRGFGPEVKRRILIGNYVLSSGYYDAYYKKAQAVRKLLKDEVREAFKRYRIIISPTSPSLPFRLGEKVNDPLSMYLTDVCTTAANLTLSPALSVPAGDSSGGLSVGVQLMGDLFSERLLLEVASAWHSEGEGAR